MTFFDHGVIEAFPVTSFATRQPYPWIEIEALLTSDGFAALLADFPSLSLFARHEGMPRMHNQRPHNRLYLAYESTPYSGEGGLAQRDDLPEVWQAFIDELETDRTYRAMITDCLGRHDLRVRYAWHAGFAGSEVSPHVDAEVKAGTHIFYFNTEDEWDSAWGGETMVLGGRASPIMNPDFTDFATAHPVRTVGNRSLIFKNAPEAWHGVEPLHCPDNSFRRLFNVIFEHPEGAPPAARTGRGDRLRRRLGRPPHNRG